MVRVNSEKRSTTSLRLDDLELTLPSGQRVYDPRGVVNAAPVAPAPRLATLDGMRLAVLDNSKWNASKLLRRTVERLQREHRLESVSFHTKESFSRVAAPELVDVIARQADAVLTAIGD